MEEKKNLLTYAGLKKLEDELHDLKVVKRKEVAGKIKEAREQGDLSENAEYDAAKDEQRDIEARIEEIEKILKNAEVVVEDEVDLDKINDLVSFRKRKYSKRFFLCTVEQKQFTGGSSACVNGKINTILQRSSPVQIVNSRTDRKTGDFCHRGRFIRMVRYKFLMIGFHFFLHF